MHFRFLFFPPQNVCLDILFRIYFINIKAEEQNYLLIHFRRQSMKNVFQPLIFYDRNRVVCSKCLQSNTFC